MQTVAAILRALPLAAAVAAGRTLGLALYAADRRHRERVREQIGAALGLFYSTFSTVEIIRRLRRRLRTILRRLEHKGYVGHSVEGRTFIYGGTANLTLVFVPYSAGAGYVNFLQEEDDERVVATYRDNYPRLVEVKTQYDPGNLFRVNWNIRPAHRSTR